MPFKSEKQRRYLWAEHPEIAKRWADKYPTKKKLPMYAKDKQDTPEKTAALHVLQSILVKTLGPATKSIFTSTCDTGTKKAESKLEHIQMPESQQPMSAGEQPVKKIPKPETEDEGSIGKEQQEGATVNPPSIPEMPLINKLAVVLAPAIQQQIENERAELEAREAARVPQNVNVKRYAVPSAAIQPPIGMAPPPAQPQAPAQPAAPAQAQSTPSVGGGSSPNANPINSFGGISAKGEFNGNASLGTQNAMGGEKLSAAIAKWAYDIGNRRQSTNVEDLRTPQPSFFGKMLGYTAPDTHRRLGRGDMPGYVKALQDRVLTNRHPAYAPNNQHTRAVERSFVDATTPQPSLTVAINNLKDRVENRTNEWLGEAPVNYDGRPADVRMQRPSGLPLSPQQEKTPVPQSGITTETQGAFNKYMPQPAQPQPTMNMLQKKSGSPAWQRAEGKNDEGGLNAKGRASYNKATGGNLKAPVTESKPTGDRAKRQNSFCSRMCGMKKHETGAKTKKDPDSRINKSLRKWNCKCSSAFEFGAKLAYDWQGRRQYTHVEDRRAEPLADWSKPFADLPLRIQARLDPKLRARLTDAARGETLSTPGTTPQSRAVERYVASGTGTPIPPQAAAKKPEYGFGNFVNDALREVGIGAAQPKVPPVQQEVAGMIKRYGPTLPPAEYQPPATPIKPPLQPTPGMKTPPAPSAGIKASADSNPLRMMAQAEKGFLEPQRNLVRAGSFVVPPLASAGVKALSGNPLYAGLTQLGSRGLLQHIQSGLDRRLAQLNKTLQP